MQLVLDDYSNLQNGVFVLVIRCLILFFLRSVMMGNKNLKNLQFSIILYNEAIVLRASFRILAWPALIFQNFQWFLKIINLCLTSLGTRVTASGVHQELLWRIHFKRAFDEIMFADSHSHHGQPSYYVRFQCILQV